MLKGGGAPWGNGVVTNFVIENQDIIVACLCGSRSGSPRCFCDTGRRAGCRFSSFDGAGGAEAASAGFRPPLYWIPIGLGLGAFFLEQMVVAGGRDLFLPVGGRPQRRVIGIHGLPQPAVDRRSHEKLGHADRGLFVPRTFFGCRQNEAIPTERKSILLAYFTCSKFLPGAYFAEDLAFLKERVTVESFIPAAPNWTAAISGFAHCGGILRLQNTSRPIRPFTRQWNESGIGTV